MVRHGGSAQMNFYEDGVYYSEFINRMFLVQNRVVFYYDFVYEALLMTDLEWLDKWRAVYVGEF